MALHLTKEKLGKQYGVSKVASDVVECSGEVLNDVDSILRNEEVSQIVDETKKSLTIPEDMLAFEVPGITLTTSDETITIPFDLKHDNIETLYDQYNISGYQSATVICTVEKSKILTDKPKNQEYYVINSGDTLGYVLKDQVSTQLPNAEITTTTLNELPYLPMEYDKLLSILMEKNPGFDIETEEGIALLDDLFEYAKDRFKERAGNLQNTKRFKKLEKMSIRKKEDFQWLIEQAKNPLENSRRDTTIHCTILKYMYLYNDMKQNPTFDLLEKIELGQVDVATIIKDIYNLGDEVEVSKNEKGIYTFPYKVAGSDVMVSFRVKSIRSIIKKALAKGEYRKLENFKDIFGMTFYVDEKDRGNIINIMKEIDLHFYNGNGSIKNKGLLKKKDIKNLDKKKQLENEKYIQVAEKNEKNTGTGEGYVDVKFVGYGTFDSKEGRDYIPEGGLELGVEAKFVFGKPDEDSNELGMSFHPIYEYFAKFFESEKNRQPFIKLKTLEEYINNFYDEVLINDVLLQKYSKTKIEIIRSVYQELSGKELSNDISNNGLKRLFNSEISEFIFKYLRDKYKFQFSTLKIGKTSETILITNDNYDQLLRGVGYRFQED